MAPSPCRRLPRLLRQQVAWAALRLPRRYSPGRWHLVPSPTLRARPLYRCPPPARQALPRDNARGRVVRYPGAQLGAGAGGSGGPSRAPRERAGVTPAAGARAVSEGRGGACPAPPPSPAAGARGTGCLPEQATAPASRVSSVRQDSQLVVAITVAVIAPVTLTSMPAGLGEDLGK